MPSKLNTNLQPKMSANFPSPIVNLFFPLSHGNLQTPFSKIKKIKKNTLYNKMCVNIVKAVKFYTPVLSM